MAGASSIGPSSLARSEANRKASHGWTPNAGTTNGSASAMKVVSLKEETSIETDPILTSHMEELTNLLLVIRNSELDQHRSMYIASAGLVMAGVDEQMKQAEYELIIHRLANYLIFPVELLQGIIDQKSQSSTFLKTASTIMQLNPAERDPMFEFLISVAMSDNELFTKEIDFLYDMGANLFKYSAKEIAQHISQVVRGNFLPKLY